MAPLKITFVEPKELKKDDLILDIRPEGRHARLALDRPHWHREARMVDPKQFIRSYGLDGKKRLNILCRSGRGAALLARRFMRAGFSNVAVVRGGMDYAVAQGLPVIRAAMPDLSAQVHLTAGGLTVLGILLGYFVSPAFYLLALLVGVGLIVSGATGHCTLSAALEKMPWNDLPEDE